MSNNVFVWIDQVDGRADSIAWEAVGVGRQVADDLGGQLAAIILGQDVAGLAGQAIQYGADSAFVADDVTLKNFRLEPYAAVITARAYNRLCFRGGYARRRGRHYDCHCHDALC